VTPRAVRDRLMDAAFELFDERGYEQTTVEDIAERAGAGRTTFFRHFRTKDEVIFPRHEVLLEAIRQRLSTSTDRTAIVAVTDAVRLVLLSHIEEGDRARQRYALTSRVPALRDREIASGAKYQRLFREFISTWQGATPLQAELMAAAVVATHNHVLRRWLRGESVDPLHEIDTAMSQVVTLFTETTAASAATEEHQGDALGTTVIVLQTDRSLNDVLPAVRRAITRLDARRPRGDQT
jgi:AcrR family transcriptional regulator